jgi:hypothetical protein
MILLAGSARKQKMLARREKVITSTAAYVQSMYAADLDGDGDLDVLSAGGKEIAWYENE